MTTDIIIPTFNQEHHTIKCLQSIENSTEKDSYRILWVDNGSTRESRKNVLSEIKNHNYLTIWSGTRLGFVKAVNLGIDNVKADYTIILNNDITVTEGWLDRLANPMEKNLDIAMCGPLTTKDTSRQSWDCLKNSHAFFAPIPEISNIKSDKELSKSLFSIFGNTFICSSVLTFFCVSIRSSIFKTIGKLDESFEEGYSDDVDFSMRVEKAGFKMAIVPSVFIHHNHRSTFSSLYGKEEISKKILTNRKKLFQKHGIENIETGNQ